jgi:hypothetical protein
MAVFAATGFTNGGCRPVQYFPDYLRASLPFWPRGHGQQRGRSARGYGRGFDGMSDSVTAKVAYSDATD